MTREIAVAGAAGHTGRFVVRELIRRGFEPVLLVRDERTLEALRTEFPGCASRAAVVINCAGPFIDTAGFVVEAALRARCHYVDVTAEQSAARLVFERFGDAAREAGRVVLPAVAFYGGLADLLATVAMEPWGAADAIETAVALERWWPTSGTRRTGARNPGPRAIIEGGELRELENGSPPRPWAFGPPFQTLDVVEVPLSEIITISRHLRAASVRSFMNLAPLADLHDAKTPPPRAADPSGQSAQTWRMEVRATHASGQRVAAAQGRDIYAFTAPLVVEAAVRLARGPARPGGAFSLGEFFEARDFLESLAAHATLELPKYVFR